MTDRIYGAILRDLTNEYGTVYGREAYLFPSSGGSWLDSALPGALDATIPNKRAAIRIAVNLNILPVWESWESFDRSDGDVWDQRRTQVCASIEAAICAAYPDDANEYRDDLTPAEKLTRYVKKHQKREQEAK